MTKLRRPALALAPALLLPALLPAALAATPASAQEAPAPVTAEAASTARVVVGDIDGSFNPYHPAFYGGPQSVTPAVLAEFGIPAARQVTLTRTGDFAADYAADKARVWDQLKAGEPVWFVGTNVIGVAFEDITDGDPATLPILEEGTSSHGTGTVGAVLQANPEAVVLFSEGTAVEAAERFVFSHPAVDVVTTSYGLPGSLPVLPELFGSYEGVTQGGKLHFGASDNSPALSPQDGTSGPWWSIAIAGFHEGTGGGRESLSGNLIDFLGDFTQTLPYCGKCETGTQSVSGTSFATPRSAGTASKILLELRRAYGHSGGNLPGSVDGPQPVVAIGGGKSVTTWQFRRALEEAAYYPSLEDYDPVTALLDDGASAPISPEAPYAQSGWGILSPDDEKYGVVPAALALLGAGGTPPATAKSAEACTFNDGVYANRVAYWSTNVQSEGFLQTETPHLECGAATFSLEDPPVVPEVPWTPLLALAAAGLGGAVLVRRRGGAPALAA